MKKYRDLSKKELKEFAKTYQSKHDFVDIMSVKQFNEIQTEKKKRIDKRTLKYKEDWYGIYTETEDMMILNLIPIADNYRWRRLCWNKRKKGSVI